MSSAPAVYRLIWRKFCFFPLPEFFPPYHFHSIPTPFTIALSYIVHQSKSRVSMAKAHSLFTYKYNDTRRESSWFFFKTFFFYPFFYFKDLRTAHVLFIIANKCIEKCIQLRDKKKTEGKHSATWYWCYILLYLVILFQNIRYTAIHQPASAKRINLKFLCELVLIDYFLFHLGAH